MNDEYGGLQKYQTLVTCEENDQRCGIGMGWKYNDLLKGQCKF